MKIIRKNIMGTGLGLTDGGDPVMESRVAGVVEMTNAHDMCMAKACEVTRAMFQCRCGEMSPDAEGAMAFAASVAILFYLAAVKESKVLSEITGEKVDPDDLESIDKGLKAYYARQD
jgi:hypothetical protein